MTIGLEPALGDQLHPVEPLVFEQDRIFMRLSHESFERGPRTVIMISFYEWATRDKSKVTPLQGSALSDMAFLARCEEIERFKASPSMAAGNWTEMFGAKVRRNPNTGQWDFRLHLDGRTVGFSLSPEEFDQIFSWGKQRIKQNQETARQEHLDERAKRAK